MVLFGFSAGLFAQEAMADSAELKGYFDLLEQEQVPITTGAGRPLTKEKMSATVTVITAEELHCWDSKVSQVKKELVNVS